MAVALTLCDRSADMVKAWRRYFPSDVGNSVNAYLAMRAILLAADTHNRAMHDRPDEGIKSVATPGLCTGTGKMPPERAAYQMWLAYRSIIMGDLDWTDTLEKQIE